MNDAVAEHALFRRRGDDVLVDLPLTFPEVALGADVVVPTLEGTTTIRIPAGTPSGKIFRLGGRGLPRVGRPGRGDLHLQVSIEVPEGLDDAQRDALGSFSSRLAGMNHPKRHAFDAAVKERQT